MSPELINWINSRIPEFAQLEEPELNAISDFSMAWSLFEGTQLSGSCSMAKLRKFADNLAQQDMIKNCGVDEYLPYLKQRYFVDGNMTHHFEHLHIERSGKADEIVKALGDEAASEKTKLIGCLGIVYRLRNNLFHGEKWRYQLRDQESNFRNATNFLLRLM